MPAIAGRAVRLGQALPRADAWARAWAGDRLPIFPGWYAGRTTHIHLRLRSTYDSTSTGGTNTTQLFFPQDTIDTINTTISPYSAEGSNPTTNASDHVYSGEVDGANLLTLSGGTTNGYTTTAKINLPITAL
jgi:hypothetical protein